MKIVSFKKKEKLTSGQLDLILKGFVILSKIVRDKIFPCLKLFIPADGSNFNRNGVGGQKKISGFINSLGNVTLGGQFTDFDIYTDASLWSSAVPSVTILDYGSVTVSGETVQLKLLL